jgi:hypothetical protein
MRGEEKRRGFPTMKNVGISNRKIDLGIEQGS